MTNFDFLLPTPDFSTFAPVAVSAEKLLHIDVDACVLNCRRAMEFAVKWMYSVDRDLVMPYQDTRQPHERRQVPRHRGHRYLAAHGVHP